MPITADNGETILTIGDFSRNGLYQITDAHWDHNGTLTVTVREMIGERELPKARLEAMRRLARRALMYPELTRSARTVRTFYSGGGMHATFAISRNERY